MIHSKEEISKKYEQRNDLDNLESYKKMKKVEGNNFYCSLHSSMFYFFKMSEVASFIRKNLREYIRKESKDDKYGYTHFYFDIEKLEDYCRGNSSYKLWKFKEDVLTQIRKYEEQDGYTDTPTGSSDICYPEDEFNESDESEDFDSFNFRSSEELDFYYNEEMSDGLTYGQIIDTDAWEQIEIVVLSNEMAVFLSTWNFITGDYRFSYSRPCTQEEEEACDKPLVQEKEEKQLFRLNKILPVKVSMTSKTACLTYNNSLSMLFDLVINEALDDKEITFIYPSAEMELAETTYQCKGWEIDDYFCNSDVDKCFKLIDFDSCYGVTDKIKRDKILHGIESFVVAGNVINKENRYEVNDACRALSTPNGQAIVFFDGKAHGDYENYKLSFLHAIHSKTECTLLGREFVSDLKKEEDNPNWVEEEKSMKLLRKLKILENDTNQDVSIVSASSIEPLWLKKTNTLRAIENLEKITSFLTKREEIKKGKTDQKILCFLDILSMVAVISYVLDSWEMIGKEPAGRGIAVLVITIILLVISVIVFLLDYFLIKE